MLVHNDLLVKNSLKCRKLLNTRVCVCKMEKNKIKKLKNFAKKC